MSFYSLQSLLALSLALGTSHTYQHRNYSLLRLGYALNPLLPAPPRFDTLAMAEKSHAGRFQKALREMSE